ncbi:MAG: hypothetical protein M3R25_07085 [Bacteroidota bacterium]|nr:hypothetical protein [Bacteroidota bacterium]
MTREIRYIGSYFIHNLQLGITPDIQLFKLHGNRVLLGLPILAQFPFNKNIRSSNKATINNKWLFEFSRLELFAQMEYELKNCHFALAYRIVNFQKKDPAILYDILFHDAYPEFLSTKTEFYNPAKFTLSFTVPIRKVNHEN